MIDITKPSCSCYETIQTETGIVTSSVAVSLQENEEHKFMCKIEILSFSPDNKGALIAAHNSLKQALSYLKCWEFFEK